MTTPGDNGDEAVIRYLSDDWLQAADRALESMPPTTEPLALGYRVNDGPDGDRLHRLVFGPDQVRALRGLEGVGLTLAMGWDTAVEVAEGRTSAQRAFLDGRIRLDGDPGVLLGHQTHLNDIDDHLAELRARTLFRW